MAPFDYKMIEHLEKLEKKVEDVMKLDADSVAVKITFKESLAVIGGIKDIYDATNKAMKLGVSDPKMLKFYKAGELKKVETHMKYFIAGELKKVETHMKLRLDGIAELFKFLVFQDKVKTSATEITRELNNYYNYRTEENKEKFVKAVQFHGPPVNVLMRLRDQLPKMLHDYEEGTHGYVKWAQTVYLVIIQMVYANTEYLHARFPEEEKRNAHYHYELMEIIRDIYSILKFDVEYPEFDPKKIEKIVKEHASSSDDDHKDIHKALKKEFENQHFLVITYNDNWKQPEKLDDGNTYYFAKEDGAKKFYVVHRFKELLSPTSNKALEGKNICYKAFSDDLYDWNYYWRHVPRDVAKQTNSFALYYTTWGGEDAIEYKLNYTIDDEAKAAFYFRDHKIEGADANDKNKKQRATLLATFV